jgi:tRNA-binding protein
LLQRQIVAVVNFPKKQIANFMSECLVLGAVGEEEDVVLLAPDFKIENGLRIG